ARRSPDGARRPMTDLAPVLIRRLEELISIPSAYPPGDTSAICRYAGDRLKHAGYQTEIVGRTKGIDNVVASLGQPLGTGGGPHLVFNAHADTVGVGERAMWRTDPLQAIVKDGLVFGLGAGNCKGSMAVQLWLAEEIARAGGPKRGTVT